MAYVNPVQQAIMGAIDQLNTSTQLRQRDAIAQAELANRSRLLDMQEEEHRLAKEAIQRKIDEELRQRTLTPDFTKIPTTTDVPNPQRLPYDMTPDYRNALAQFINVNRTPMQGTDVPTEAWGGNYEGTRPYSPTAEMTFGEYTGPTAGQPATIQQARPQAEVYRDQVKAVLDAMSKGYKIDANMDNILKLTAPQEEKPYTVGNALVDKTGKVLYQGGDDKKGRVQIIDKQVGKGLVQKVGIDVETGKELYNIGDPFKPTSAQSLELRMNQWRQGKDLPPGWSFNSKTNKFTKPDGTAPTGDELLAASLGYTVEKGAAKQSVNAQSANVSAASKVYDKEAVPLIALRNKVQSKGLLPAGGFKDINALNQWLGQKVSDPDVVLLQKKTKLLADALQKTIGGSQGGEWAFKVAADILDPTYAPETFQAVIESHGDTLREMAQARREFGGPLGYTPPAKQSSLADRIAAEKAVRAKRGGK